MKEKDVKKWLEKVEKAKKGDVDLSRDEDLSIALMNLVSLEEHFYFTAMKTGNKKYLDLLRKTREVRKELLAWIVKDPAGEEWCISKHLLAASMRLVEVGTKELARDERAAHTCFKHAFNLYSLFFAINLKVIGVEELEEAELEREGKESGFKKFSELVKKLVDCCKEW